uniref:Uncharacterized protein n=1 Tax=Oryza rufipogon TaxID=4529 RepID=A0A0E0RAK6_ORYRU
MVGGTKERERMQLLSRVGKVTQNRRGDGADEMGPPGGMPVACMHAGELTPGITAHRGNRSDWKALGTAAWTSSVHQGILGFFCPPNFQLKGEEPTRKSLDDSFRSRPANLHASLILYQNAYVLTIQSSYAFDVFLRTVMNMNMHVKCKACPNVVTS